MDAEGAQQVQRRRVPAGTSDYQAAWILDDDGAVDDDEDGGGAGDQPFTPSQSMFPGQTSSGAPLRSPSSKSHVGLLALSRPARQLQISCPCCARSGMQASRSR